MVLLPAGRGWSSPATWAWEPASLLGPEGPAEAGSPPPHVPVQRLPPAGHLGTGRSSGGRAGLVAEHRDRKDWEAMLPHSWRGVCLQRDSRQTGRRTSSPRVLGPTCDHGHHHHVFGTEVTTHPSSWGTEPTWPGGTLSGGTGFTMCLGPQVPCLGNWGFDQVAPWCLRAWSPWGSPSQHVCVRACACMCMFVCTCAHMRVHIHVYVCACMCACACACMCGGQSYMLKALSCFVPTPSPAHTADLSPTLELPRCTVPGASGHFTPSDL